MNNTEIGKLFPTLNRTVASYDHSNFYIYLEDISEADLLTIRAAPFTSKNIEHIKTLFHEIRHSVDHLATLWGQKNILLYLKAINTRLNNTLEEFPTIVKYKQQINQLFYSEYYTEEYNYIPVKTMDQRWQWAPTCGIKFDAHGSPDPTQPIPLIQFLSYNNVPLMRTPLSVASLLETNSVAQEVQWHLNYLTQLSETERLYHIKFYERDTLFKLLYNQDLAVYNVAVHLASNLLNISDLIEAFRISSTVATLALNLPDTHVKTLPIKDDKFKAWGERCQFMLDNNEYGFIYFVLLDNYREVYKGSRKFSIEELLQASDLPKEDELLQLILREFEKLRDEAIKQPNLSTMFVSQMEKGKAMLTMLGPCFDKCSIAEAILHRTPTLICNDTNINMKTIRDQELYAMKPIQNNLTLSEWYNISSAINNKLNQLYEVRGV